MPLQMIEFYLMSSQTLTGQMFLRLLFGTVAMLAFGYLGIAQSRALVVSQYFVESSSDSAQ